MTAPILVSLALGDDAVLQRATTLALALDAPLLVTHALGWRLLETEAQLTARLEKTRQELDVMLEPARAAGVQTVEAVVERQRPGELVIETASTKGAQMIVTGGGGGGDSVRRWLVGSVAESIVRASTVPTLVVRGDVADDRRPVLCPVDFSPHARQGLVLAARMARATGRRLVVLTVVPPNEAWQSKKPIESLPDSADAARTELPGFLAGLDLSGVQVEHRVLAHPDGAVAIAEASKEGSLLVMATRAFGGLASNAIGAFTERVLGWSQCSCLVVRVADTPDDDALEDHIVRLAQLKRHAEAQLAAGRPANALPLLELAVGRASGNARLQELYADALAGVGRNVEAARRRKLAASIREQLDGSQLP